MSCYGTLNPRTIKRELLLIQMLFKRKIDLKSEIHVDTSMEIILFKLKLKMRHIYTIYVQYIYIYILYVIYI